MIGLKASTHSAGAGPAVGTPERHGSADSLVTSPMSLEQSVVGMDLGAGCQTPVGKNEAIDESVVPLGTVSSVGAFISGLENSPMIYKHVA